MLVDIKQFSYFKVIKNQLSNDVFQDLCPDKEQKLAFHQRILELEKQCEDTYITKVIEPCIEDGGSLHAEGCLGGTTRIDIEPDLTVMACPMSDEVLGSLADQTFEEMWFSDKAERIRAEDRPYCVNWL